MPGPALLDRIDRAIAELQAIRADVAAGDPSPPINGAGDTLVRLRAMAVELGARISGDDRVGERDAALLLGVQPETLGKQRQEGRSPPSYRIRLGVRGCSVQADGSGCLD